MSRVIAYGQAHHSEADQRNDNVSISTWIKQHDKGELVLWRREGRHRLDQPAHERPALTQALFLLRADLADVLWLVPGPEVLGSSDQRSRQTAALILAEAWAAGAQVVWGKDASGLEPDPVAQQVAEQCLLLADRFDPRQDQHDETGPADMGNYLDEEETARLAYKLRTDLYLSNEEIADLLNTSGFYSPRRRPLTPQP